MTEPYRESYAQDRQPLEDFHGCEQAWPKGLSRDYS
jgi:hypothetical protein